MSVLLSVNPPHAGKLVDGIKTVELRKNLLPKGKTYIYETIRGGGQGMVIGEVEFVGMIANEPWRVPDFILEGACVDRAFVLKYADWQPIFANFCVNSKRYEKPIPLTKFKRLNRSEENAPCAHAKALYEPCETCRACNLTRPPQAWCYVEELKK